MHVKVRVPRQWRSPQRQLMPRGQLIILPIVHSGLGARSVSKPKPLMENISDSTRGEEQIPSIEFDYTFGSGRVGDPLQEISMLVAVDSVHKSVLAVQARRKGSSDEYVVSAFLNYIDGLGLKRAELKCDQEPSTIDLRGVLIKKCQSTTLIPYESPKGSKGSLGQGERANLRVQGQLRALRLATAERYKAEIAPDSKLTPWMIRHCGWIHDKFQVKDTGTTPHKSKRGKNYTAPILGFAEVCLFRNHDEDNAKLNPGWNTGVFLSERSRAATSSSS